MDPIIPDSDGQTLQVKQLNAAQVDAQQGPDYAGQAGLTGPKAPAPAPEPQDSWGALVKDHPVLSQHLTDPDFARAAKDDIPQLSKIERLFGGWDEMLWKSKLDIEADTRNQTLAAIGRAQKAGTATPEMLKQADDLEKEASSVQEPNVGFVPGIVPAVAGVIPGLLRAAPTAFKYGVAGLFGGALLTKNREAALAAGGAMAGAGLTVGMAMDTARTEEGLAYRQYIKAGADPKTAEVAADLVALANGGLQAIPVEKVFNMVPGISNLLAGKKTRDLVGSLITSNTGRAALQRFALRAGESGLLMALVGGGQELVRELGALGAGADKELHGGKIWDASTGGFQQGLGFGIGHALLPFVQEKREAQIGLARGEMYKAIAGESTNSKLRESMPGPFKNYVNAVIAEHGNVDEAKAPAEKLTSLLQKEGITDEQVQERMPEVAKQLREAGPQDEIVIPMGDLATHLAPLKSFEEFSQDLRVGDDSLTPRESKKIGELADKFEKEQPAKEGEEPEPGRKVFDDVYDQLTKAGQDPNVARHDASLWAAFATSRGERLGVDPFEYYKSRSVSVGAEFPDTGTTLGQKYKPGETYKFKIKNLKLDDRNFKDAEDNLRRGQGSQTEGPIKLYRREGSRKLEVGDGHHRILEAMSRGEAYIDGQVEKDALPRELPQLLGESESHRGGKAPNVDFEKSDLQDGNARVDEEAIRKTYGGSKNAAIYRAYVPFEDLPNPELAEENEKVEAEEDRATYPWEDFDRRGTFPPAKIKIKKDGTIEILDGNHRMKWWEEAGFTHAPAWVIDERKNAQKALESREEDLYQPAYHGSPHHFTKFTLDHIGSGEGAQVYGWGLYFAEEKAVAEFYKDSLKQPDEINEWRIGNRYLYKNGEVADYSPRTDSPADHAWGTIAEQMLIHENEMRDQFTLNGEEGVRDFMRKMLDDEIKNTDKDEWGQKLIPEFEKLKKKLENDKLFKVDIKENKSRIYEVDVPDKKELLDYDKPISKQEPAILEKLQKAGLLTPKESPREQLEAFLRTDFAKSFSDSSEVRVVKYLLERGDEDEIESFIKTKLKDPSAAITNNILKNTGSTLYEKLSQKLGGDREASLALHKAGIPGAKYLDQNSRDQGGVLFYGDKPSALHVQEPQKVVEDFTSRIQERVNSGVSLEGAVTAEIAETQRLAAMARDHADRMGKSAGSFSADRDSEYAKRSMKAEELRSTAYKLEQIAEWTKTLSPDDFDVSGGTHNFVIWDENAIQTLNVLEQRGGAAGTEGYRGKISFDDARSYFNITLTGKANLSTFLHESGHAFFEFMRKDAESGHAQSAEDFGKLLEWMGVKPGEQPSTEQLEQFARGFEGYLMEGKAPAPEMRGLFRTFASWLKSVYKGMKSLGVNLTDDVRGVMDRMLASDKEIEKAKAGLGLEPMKKPDEGMTDAEYKAYTEKFGKAMEAGRNELEERALREFRSTIGEERAKTQADVEQATRLDPAHNAYEALRTGKRLDGGEVPEEIAGKKLDREAVAEAGHKGIKWASITEEGGIDPDVAAPLLGYENGPALLDALESRRSRTKEIKEETERRMMDKYPNSDIAKMSEQAVTALHLKDDVGNVLWLEAKALGKQIGQEDPRTARAVVKEIARRRVSEMTALEMQPGRFARGEERAAGEWADAMKAKDFAEAHRAKLDQILNHEMFKAVSEAKDEVDSIRNYLDGFNELPNRRRLGKAGQSYLSAVDAIISDIELKRQTNKTLTRRASLESYLAEMENEDGALITIPAELRSEAALKNYKQMTLDDLRTVHDAVANIEAMARLKNKLFDGRERRNYMETAVRLSETVKINLGSDYAEKPGAPQNPSWWAKKKAMLREGVAEMKKIEFLARAMDGGETAGWVHSVLFQPFATAEEKALNLTKKITEQLFKPLRDMSLKERAQFDKTVDFLGTPMKMRDVIAVALNMGNAGNKRKLIDGYGFRGWTEEAMTARLGELLTDKHIDLIEHFWKTIGSLWPEIKALSERTTGVAPPKVEPTKLTIRGRELEGGYYPIVYDRDRSYKAEQIAQKKGDLFENNFLKPGVSKGFTETRTQFAAPILLSLNVIPSHMNEVIHYLTHLEPIRAVDRLMSHSAVRKSITEGMGKETYNLFRPWLQAIAHDGVVQSNTTMIDNMLRHLRVGASVTRLGFKLSNSIMQGFNILSSVKELGGFTGGSKYLTLGMKAWMRDFDSFIDPFKAVHEQSPEIRGKTEKYEQNLIGNFDHFTSAFSEFGHYKERLGHFAMSFMTLAWKSVETLTWYAAREKAFAEEHPRPLEYADSVVRLSQMGEGMKDKAAIMRGGEGTKIFTYMYSWYSTIFNQLTETQPQARGGVYKAGELASRYWWMVLAPTVLMSLARGKRPKNDDGEAGSEAGYLAGEVALETAKAYLGPIGGITADTMLSGHDAKFAPWISTVLRGLAVRGKMAVGHPLTDKEKKDLFESTGIISHLPAGGMYNALKYVSAVQDGKLEEPVRDLLFRSPGDWK